MSHFTAKLQESRSKIVTEWSGRAMFIYLLVFLLWKVSIILKFYFVIYILKWFEAVIWIVLYCSDLKTQ